MSYQELLADAIDAAKGHPIDYWAASQHARRAEKISAYPSSVEILMKTAGRSKRASSSFRRIWQDLSRRSPRRARKRSIVDRWARKTAAFYESMGGLLKYEDLAKFRAEQAEPIHTSYAGLEVYQSAPNSQGIVMLMALNILEGYELEALGHNSAEYLHVVTEAMKLAFADRNQYVGDPRFVDVPTEALLSKDYAAARRELIRKDHAMVSAPPGDPKGNTAILEGYTIDYAKGTEPIQSSSQPENLDGETSSFSIADRFGNLVSVTHSVNSGFGSGMAVEGAGYFLNNRMPYFSLEKDDVNALVPGKRTRHTVNPALALKDGQPYLAWNTPGGDNQPQAMLQTFLNVVHFGMNVQQSVEAAHGDVERIPRVDVPWAYSRDAHDAGGAGRAGR